MKLIIFSLIGILSCIPVYALNILVLESVPSPSHHIWIRTLTTELAKQGYNVTSLSSDIEDNPPENLHYLHMETVYPGNEKNAKEANISPMDFGDFHPWLMAFMYNFYKIQYCEFAIASNGFKELLNYPNNFKFDLILADFTLTPCLIGFAHKFNYPPILGLSPINSVFFTTPYVGSPLHLSYSPHGLFKTAKKAFSERIENYVLHMLDYFQNYIYINPSLNRLVKSHFTGMVSLEDIQRRFKAILFNQNFAIDLAEPILPNIIPVGGLQIQRNKSLTEDFQELLDRSGNGLVLFSLGTNMKSKDLGADRINEILVAFQNLPRYTFLWKFEAEDLPKFIPDNVIIKKFVPQNDILAHPNTKLFISHCGLLSMQESIWHGVPILGTPIFVDQFMNIEKAVSMGIAEKYDIREINSATFATAISTMLTEPKYEKNVKIRSKLFRDQKESPLDLAVWWVKLILDNPDADYIQNPARSLNIIQRQSIDVIAFLTLITILVFYIEVKLILRCLRKKNPIEEDDNNKKRV